MTTNRRLQYLKRHRKTEKTLPRLQPPRLQNPLRRLLEKKRRRRRRRRGLIIRHFWDFWSKENSCIPCSDVLESRDSRRQKACFSSEGTTFMWWTGSHFWRRKRFETWIFWVRKCTIRLYRTLRQVPRSHPNHQGYAPNSVTTWFGKFIREGEQ